MLRILRKEINELYFTIEYGMNMAGAAVAIACHNPEHNQENGKFNRFGLSFFKTIKAAL